MCTYVYIFKKYSPYVYSGTYSLLSIPELKTQESRKHVTSGGSPIYIYVMYKERNKNYEFNDVIIYIYIHTSCRIVCAVMVFACAER